MITNKDIRVENGSLILNGDPYPLDGQSPEAIMQIVEDNSDTTPTENSTAPITSGGVFTADKAISDTIGDITQTGVTGSSVAAQLDTLNDEIAVQSVNIDTLKTSDVSACYGTLYKINGLVLLNFTALYNSEKSAGTTALSLPSGYIPSAPVYGNGTILKSSGEAYTALVKINTNGNVFGDTSTTGTVLNGTLIYKI